MDFSMMTDVQVIGAFITLGFSSGMVVHWVAKAGTAARWALNAGS